MAELPDKDKLLRNFSRCANWEEKYLYIIELGQRLPPLGEEAHSPENSIQGCQSQVWIVMAQSDDGTIELRGDSDAAIALVVDWVTRSRAALNAEWRTADFTELRAAFRAPLLTASPVPPDVRQPA